MPETVTQDGCQFCAIGSGDLPARIVWQDELTLAFLPLNPAARGHLLVVPRNHVRDLWDLDDELAAHLTQSVLTVARGVRKVLQPEGLNIINSAGAAASQTVWHLHVHIVPRWSGDDMGPIWPSSSPAAQAAQTEVEWLVRAAFESPSRPSGREGDE